MMTKKQEIRKQLEAGLAVFLSSGGAITKAAAQKKPGKRKEPKEKMVEIEIDFLPEALRKKHFGE